MLSNEVVAAIKEAADKSNVPFSHLAAVVEVESAGTVYATIDGERYPVILFEPHVIYRLTSGKVRDKLVEQRLASPVWNKKLYGKTQAERWDQVHRAYAIAGDVAFEAASYGVGQVLGEHWRDLGYASIGDFLKEMYAGVEGQIAVMMKFITFHHLDDELREGRWAAYARGYNGPAYAKNHYDTKLAAAAARFGGEVAKPDGMLRRGAKGARVRELQALLVRAGFQLKVDGDFGNTTDKAVRAFQKAHGITVDGKVGPETQGALAKFRQGPQDAPGKQSVTEIEEVKQGAGGALVGLGIEKAKDALDAATAQVEALGASGPVFQYVLTGLAVVGAALAIGGLIWAVRGFMKSKQTVEA